MNETESYDIHDNTTFVSQDLNNVFLNPHLHNNTQVGWWINVACIPSVTGLGLFLNFWILFYPPYPFTLPRILSVSDMLLLLLYCWDCTPPGLDLPPHMYIPASVYTKPLLEGLQTFSTYLLVIFISIRFLRMMEHADYGYIRPVIYSLFLSLLIFIPDIFTYETQELTGAEIREYLKITELEEVKFQVEMNVVVRSTQFSHDTNIENIFLLFRFLVLQITPVWILIIIGLSAYWRKTVNQRLRRSSDPVPLALSLLFLVLNLPELSFYLLIILKEIPHQNLLRVLPLLRVLVCTGKPVIYLFYESGAQLRKYVKHKQMKREAY
ncbi:uncharacterized protein LOC111718308 [Eurytemora carolleeae]|uniref:uncharacterized protein LOC111718308 n=1 Tax=Eurytemora carolleeae TaxID=1294199 RepID=UPI000C763922|nr:uncharacterized protein LOC111718308 [Eurytemora carolleeae]|eukprot:XP_023349633.1 uncharacterized protein LOC111718308 [Eurytemora affinis]